MASTPGSISIFYEQEMKMDIENFVLNSTTLLVIVFGLVEFIKTLGVKGNVLRIISMTLGIGIAVVFKLSQIYPSWSPWIEIGAFGIVIGLTASGIYEFINKRLPRQDV
jgi:membrane protein implicated in regulation of membrane protease activity